MFIQVRGKYLNLQGELFLADSLVYYSCSEKLNIRAYLRALEDGLLENHRGRFVFISKGKMLNKSFKRAHDVYDHVFLVNETMPSQHAMFVYVPI